MDKEASGATTSTVLSSARERRRWSDDIEIRLVFVYPWG
jgi:hypothetical protein